MGSIKGASPSHLPLTLPTETTEPRHSGSTGKSTVVSVFSLLMTDGVGGGLRVAGLGLAHFYPGVDSPHRVSSIGSLITCPGPLVAFWGLVHCWDSASLIRTAFPMPAGEEGLSAEAGKGAGSSQGTTAGEWPV